ncbi:MAG TPA: WD40 repeat domain-containing protein [Ktedonobacteraceae bacterium]|nr:WD40 repeat domain-containing protein [Ktedonobacteraceae bacterium]
MPALRGAVEGRRTLPTLGMSIPHVTRQAICDWWIAVSWYAKETLLMTVLTSLATFSLPPLAGTIRDLVWSPDGTQLAAVTSAGYLFVWQTTRGACIVRQQVRRGPLSALAWSPHGRCLLLGDTQGGVSFFRLATQTLTTLLVFSQAVTRLAWSAHAVPSRFFVITGTTLHLFTQGRVHPWVCSYGVPLHDACWSPEGERIALVGAPGLIEIWDAVTRRAIWRQTSQGACPSHVSWDGAGQRLAVGTHAGTVQIHDLRTRACQQTLALSPFPLHSVQWGAHALVGGSERDFAVWQEAQACPSRCAMPTSKCVCHPAGLVLATASHGTVVLASLSLHEEKTS